MATQFFEPPLNKAPKKLVDKRLDTFDTGQPSGNNRVLTFNVDAIGNGTGAAQPFTHIYMVHEGVTSYGVQATGGNVLGINVVMPTRLTDDSDYSVNPVIDGFHYDLFHWEHVGETKNTAQYLTFTLVGSNIKVYQLLVLNEVMSIDSISDFRIQEDLAGVEQISARGQRSVSPPIAGERDKRRVSLATRSPAGEYTDTVARNVSAFMRKYRSFVFSLDFTRNPDMLFEAMNGERQVSYVYRTNWKAQGRRALFVVQEL